MPTGDCERIVDGLLMQPVNAISSLAFVAVGLLVPVVVQRRVGTAGLLSSLFGLVLILVGVGSVAFHGPGGPVADWLHDSSISALLLLVIAVQIGRWTGWTSRRLAMSWGGLAAGLSLIGAIWPRLTDPLNAGLGFVAVMVVIGSGLRTDSRPSNDGSTRGKLIGAIIMAFGGGLMILSRTGGLLCAPDSVIQGHAIWHLAAAVGIGWYAVSVLLGPDPIDSKLSWPSSGRSIS